MLVQAIVDVVSLHRDALAQVLTEPSSCANVFLQAFHSKRQRISSECGNLLERIMQRVIQDSLVKQGVEEDDANHLFEILSRQKIDLTRGFSSPQATVQTMLTMVNKLSDRRLTCCCGARER